MTRLAFTVPGPPVGKQRPRVTSRGTFTPEKTRAYEKAIGMAARAAVSGRRWPLAGKYAVHVVAYYADARHRDLDNVIKSALDGMEGPVFLNDSSVIEIHARRELDRAKPRTEVVVEVVA